MNWQPIRRLGLIIMLGLFATACESGLGKTVFVVLPDDDGKVGQITIDDGKSSQTLNQAYATAHVQNGDLKATTLDRKQIEQIFAEALKAQPILPARFTVHFESDTDALTAESIAVLDMVVTDIGRRSSYLVEVVGHTDRKASDAYNTALSLRRASVVREFLIEKGIAGDTLVATGRGEFDPVIPTADKVAEPRNRRVEITVR